MGWAKFWCWSLKGISVLDSWVGRSETWFWLLLLLMPTQLGVHFWPEFTRVYGLRIDYLAPTVYVTDILAVLLLVSWGREKVKARGLKLGRGWVWGILGLVGWAGVNIAMAGVPMAALVKWVRVGELIGVFLYVVKSDFPMGRYWLPMSLSVAGEAGVAIGQFVTRRSLGGIWWWLGERAVSVTTPGVAKMQLCLIPGGGCQMWLRPYATFSHPNSLAGWLVVMMVLLVGLRGERGGRGWGKKLIGWRFGGGPSTPPKGVGVARDDKLFDRSLRNVSWWVVFGLAGVALGLTGSRTAWAAAGVVVVVGWVMGRWPSLKKPRGANWGLLGLAGLAGAWPWGLRHLTDLKVVSGAVEFVAGRNELAIAAERMVRVHWVGGVGLNNFIPGLPKYLMAMPTLQLLQPVHNIFWLVAAETGLAGLVMVVWGLVMTGRQIGGRRWLALVMMVILITGANDHYWLTLPQNQLLVTLVLGLIWRRG